MVWWRWVLGHLLRLLLFVFLGTAIAAAGLMLVIGKPQNIKQALADSGIYRQIIPSIIEQQQVQQRQKTQSSRAEDLALNNPQVRKIIIKSFPPSLLERSSGQIIDGTYAWLSGQTAKPVYKINLAPYKNLLSQNTGQYAQHKLAKLPVCQSVPAGGYAIYASGAPSLSTNQIFNAKCVPPGFDRQQAVRQVRQAVSRAQFLPKSTITADTLAGSHREPFSERFSAIPTAFQWANRLPWLLMLLALLAGLGLVFAEKTRLSGLKHVGIVLAITGVVALAAVWLLGHPLDVRIDKAVASADINKGLLSSITAAALSLKDKIQHYQLVFGAVAAILGLAAILASYFLRQRSNPESPIVPGAIGQ